MASAVADSARRNRLAVASATCIFGAYIALALPFLGVPIAAGALAWMYYRGHRALAVALAVFAGALTFLVDPAGPLYVTPWLLISGPLVASVFQRRSVAMVLLVSTVLMSLVWVGLLFGVAAVEGTSVNDYMRSVVSTATKPALDSVVGNTTDARQTRDQIVSLEGTFVRLWPAIVGIMSLFTTLGVVFAVSISARMSGVSVKSPPDLDRLDLSPHVVWGLIVGGGLLAADAFLRGWNGGVLGMIGENLLRITQWVLFLQGVAVFASLYKRAGFSRLSKVFGYILLGITEAVLPLVSLTGLVDVFVNIRKVPRDGVTPVAPPLPEPPGGTQGEDRTEER